jgi:hypothetical protein
MNSVNTVTKRKQRIVLILGLKLTVNSVNTVSKSKQQIVLILWLKVDNE